MLESIIYQLAMADEIHLKTTCHAFSSDEPSYGQNSERYDPLNTLLFLVAIY